MCHFNSRLALLFVVFTMLITSCRQHPTINGSGQAAEENREVGEFRSVSYSLPGKLTIEQSKTFSLRIEADDNLLEHIRSEVRDGGLHLDTDNVHLRPKVPIHLRLSAPVLDSISAAGSGDVEAVNPGIGQLKLSNAGSGSTHLSDLKVDHLHVQSASSGNIHLAGRAQNQTILLAGSGNVDAQHCEGVSVEVSITGSGSAIVHANEQLNAEVFGSGSVRYYGAPKVSQKTVGSGQIEKAD